MSAAAAERPHRLYRCQMRTKPGTPLGYDGYVDIWSNSDDENDLFILAVRELRRTNFPGYTALNWQMITCADITPHEPAATEQSISALTELRQENQRLKEILNIAAGLLYRLEQHYFINAVDDGDKYLVNQWRQIGRDVVKRASALLNTHYNPNGDNHGN